MTSSKILSQKKLHLDYRVWLVMLIVCFACLGLIAYDKVINNKHCQPFNITVKSLAGYNSSNSYTTEEVLIFNTSSDNSKKTIWDFDDNTRKETLAHESLRHTFWVPGTFNVTASTANGCTSEIIVRIKRLKKDLTSTESTDLIKPKIYGNYFPKAGKRQHYFSDLTSGTLEWKILDKASFPVITGKDAFYTFPEPGLYVLQLLIDHDRRKRSELEIMVSEDVPKVPVNTADIEVVHKRRKKRPIENKNTPPVIAQKPKEVEVAPPEPVKNKKASITNELFLSKLTAVVNGRSDYHDFNMYLIDDGNTKVLVNKEKKPKTFKELCDDLQGSRKIVILSVELIKTDDNNIQQINVTYKRKGFLGL